MTWVKRLIAVAFVVGVAGVVLGDVPAPLVFGPLVSYGILRVGFAMFGSLHQGASYVPDGPPQPVDTRLERTTYFCSGCGAEVLLLVRGADVAPRHCGERMAERREVARDVLS